MEQLHLDVDKHSSVPFYLQVAQSNPSSTTPTDLPLLQGHLGTLRRRRSRADGLPRRLSSRRGLRACR